MLNVGRLLVRSWSRGRTDVAAPIRKVRGSQSKEVNREVGIDVKGVNTDLV